MPGEMVPLLLIQAHSRRDGMGSLSTVQSGVWSSWQSSHNAPGVCKFCNRARGGPDILTLRRPISTYSGQGVAKPGVNPQEHTIIHMRGSEPFAGKNEPRMTKDPLEVKPDSHDQKLDRMSRLNFGKVYTVEHNVKVMPVGSISRSSMPKLLGYARESFSRVGRSNEARYQHGRTPSAFAPAYNEFTLDNSHGYSAGTAAIVPDYFAHTSFHPPSSGR